MAEEEVAEEEVAEEEERPLFFPVTETPSYLVRN